MHNHKKPNKPLTRPFKTPNTRLFEAPKIDAVYYTKKDLQQNIQSVLQAQVPKRRLSGDKLKAKSPDVYCTKFHLECYNFCQPYKNHFATVGATELN